LPQPSEVFALEFPKRAMDAGFDLLITLMPMTGINRTDPTEKYWARVYGYPDDVEIDPRLLEPPAFFHSIYEVIDDPDHYMHYFVDRSLRFQALQGRDRANPACPVALAPQVSTRRPLARMCVLRRALRRRHDRTECMRHRQIQILHSRRRLPASLYLSIKHQFLG
jgi:hypothetical protein